MLPLTFVAMHQAEDFLIQAERWQILERQTLGLIPADAQQGLGQLSHQCCFLIRSAALPCFH